MDGEGIEARGEVDEAAVTGSERLVGIAVQLDLQGSAGLQGVGDEFDVDFVVLGGAGAGAAVEVYAEDDAGLQRGELVGWKAVSVFA